MKYRNIAQRANWEKSHRRDLDNRMVYIPVVMIEAMQKSMEYRIEQRQERGWRLTKRQRSYLRNKARVERGL